MTSLPLTSLVTLLVVLLMFVNGLNVARARGLYGIRAPAVTGHDMFERAYRVQMNTLENAAMMLPALWLYAGLIDDRGAGAMGVIWLVARVWYGVAYQKNPSSRGGGFTVALLANLGLWLGAAWGLLRLALN
ncbi:MAG: MAPEG family protein [Sulfuritalea sp.]|nr:MAPEG family protein [Sulfuritalea sp.]